MRRFVLLAAAVVVAAACSDSSSPTAPASPVFQIGSGPACSANALRFATADVFGNGSTEKALARNISDNPNTSAANAIGFDLFAKVAALREAEGWDGTLAPAAAELSVQLIACMNVENSGDISADAFEAALGAAGGFQVRGGPSDPAGDVISADGGSGVHAPLPWADWMGSRALFYGYPVETFATEISGGNAFDWSTVRAIADGDPDGPSPFVGPATVALCADGASIGATQAQLRVQHQANDNGGVILPVAPGGFLDCSGLALSPVDHTTVGGRLMLALLELVRPAPLFASTVAFGGIGGLKGSFSPFEVVYGAQIVLTFEDQPANGLVNTALTGKAGGELSVKVTAAEGTPWEGIVVHIDAVTNNGKGVTACGNEATTDEQGVAHFPNLTVSKAGGYFLVATTIEENTDPDVAAYSTATVNSNRFNLKNSTVPAPCS